MDAREQCWCVRHSLDCHALCCSIGQCYLNKHALCLRQATLSYFNRALSPACVRSQRTSLYMDVSAFQPAALPNPCMEPFAQSRCLSCTGSALCVRPG